MRAAAEQLSITIARERSYLKRLVAVFYATTILLQYFTAETVDLSLSLGASRSSRWREGGSTGHARSGEQQSTGVC